MEAYIHQQLHPETIEDGATEKAVAGYDTLTMTSAHLMDQMYADIRNFSSFFVTELVEPLLHEPQLQFVKAYYHRPLHGEPTGEGLKQ